MKVYIADAEDLIRNWLADVIRHLKNVEVVGTSNNLTNVLEQVRLLRPGTLILDFGSQIKQGTNIIQAVKCEPEPPSIIIFSNKPSAPYRQHWLDTGADFFFDKAVENIALIKTLKSLSLR